MTEGFGTTIAADNAGLSRALTPGDDGATTGARPSCDIISGPSAAETRRGLSEGFSRPPAGLLVRWERVRARRRRSSGVLKRRKSRTNFFFFFLKNKYPSVRRAGHVLFCFFANKLAS